MGPLSGVSREEGFKAYEEAKRQWTSGALHYTHEGGESYADIRRRAVPAFEALVARHGGGTIVVVAHGVVIRVLLTTLLEGYGPEQFQAIAIPNVGINDLRHETRRWHAVSLASAE
jgi:broad specificity phosphatase PhoE